MLLSRTKVLFTGLVHPKIKQLCHHWLTLMSFQTHKTIKYGKRKLKCACLTWESMRFVFQTNTKTGLCNITVIIMTCGMLDPTKAKIKQCAPGFSKWWCDCLFKDYRNDYNSVIKHVSCSTITPWALAEQVWVVSINQQMECSEEAV